MPKKTKEYDEYEITDENQNQIYEDDLVEQFFLQRKSAAEFNQAVVLIKLKNSSQENLNGPQIES